MILNYGLYLIKSIQIQRPMEGRRFDLSVSQSVRGRVRGKTIASQFLPSRRNSEQQTDAG